MRSYCTQNDGDCSTCSLVNYNRDCLNNPLHGGYRPGAGRKPTGRSKRQYFLSDDEDVQVKKLIEQLRDPS